MDDEFLMSKLNSKILQTVIEFSLYLYFILIPILYLMQFEGLILSIFKNLINKII